MGLGLEDVGGNLEPNSFLVHALKKRVTLETAGQESVQLNVVADRFEDFANLLEQLLTPDQETATQLRSLGESPIPGQSNPALPAAPLNDLIILDPIIVSGVVSQDAQPPGQAAQHDVGEKFSV
jgi:hypothetical protein